MKLIFKRKIEDSADDDTIVNFLLKDRGISDRDDFLKPPHPFDIPFEQLFSLKQFEKVVKKLTEIREKNEMIVVYTDYDADGITGGAILWETLYLLGFKVMPYVPHRRHEGYGFSKKGIDAVKQKFNPSLIISVDHGIAAADKITYAKKLGIPIIVTDHHMKSKHSPDDAYAVFHTDKLSGAGVAYFFAKEIYSKLKIKNSRQAGSPHTGSFATRSAGEKLKLKLENCFKQDYAALAAIGTVADLVPLVGVARSMVKHGLAAFPLVRRVGIRHILKEAGIEHKPITPYEIGFIIAPRINAVGRIRHAIDALRLLCTTKNATAFDLAYKIGDLNKERKDLVERALEEVEQKVKNLPCSGSQTTPYAGIPLGGKKLKVQNMKIIFLTSHHWHEGIIGLIAAKIAEQYYRPTIIATIADGFAKASARSIPGFDITSFLRSHAEYLIDVGGHKSAAGFTIETKQIDSFVKVITQSAEAILSEKELTRSYMIDMTLPFCRATFALTQLIEQLSPFGAGNPRPIFYSEGVLKHSSYFGKKKEHVKIYTDNGYEVIFFGKSADLRQWSKGQKIGIAYTLEIDRWHGREKVRSKGIAVLPAIKYHSNNL